MCDYNQTWTAPLDQQSEIQQIAKKTKWSQTKVNESSIEQRTLDTILNEDDRHRV